MKSLLIIWFILIIDYNAYSQAICDTSIISDIINLQIKIADRASKYKFAIKISSTEWDIREMDLPEGPYNLFLCDRNMNWNFLLKNLKFGTIKTDTTSSLDYTCIIGTPLFNENKTKCRIVMATFAGEWGSSGRYYFYEKKGKKWKLLRRSSLIWIS
jgi:hypothetical protein